MSYWPINLWLHTNMSLTRSVKILARSIIALYTTLALFADMTFSDFYRLWATANIIWSMMKFILVNLDIDIANITLNVHTCSVCTCVCCVKILAFSKIWNTRGGGNYQQLCRINIIFKLLSYLNTSAHLGSRKRINNIEMWKILYQIIVFLSHLKM